MKNELEYKEVWVQMDWGSSGVWVRYGRGNYLANASYEHFNLQDDLIKRFEYWEEWYNGIEPEKDDEYNKMDQLLFDSYGRSLAVDLKEFLGDTCRVYFGNFKKPIEILLEKREHNGSVVPVSITKREDIE